MITTNQSLVLKNTLIVRREVTLDDLQNLYYEVMRYLTAEGASINGNMVTATHGVKGEGSDAIQDMELIIPLNRAISGTEEFRFEKEFCIDNAVMMRHDGSITEIEKSMSRLYDFINENRFNINTASYQQVIQNIGSAGHSDNMIMDIYVGVESIAV